MQRPKPDPLRDFDAFDPRSMTPRPARRARHLTPAQKVVLFGGSFSPLQIPGLQLWVDAGLSTLWQDSARTTPAVADADPVGAIDDLSGNGKNATQSTDIRRPALKLAIQNGRPILRYLTNYLATASISHNVGTGGFWFISVVSITSEAFYNTLMSNGVFAPVIYADLTTSKLDCFLGGVQPFDNSIFGAFKITECWRDGSTIKAAINGTTEATTYANATSIPDAICYLGFDNSTAYLNGDMGTNLFYNKTPTQGERSALVRYLGKLWGIAVTI